MPTGIGRRAATLEGFLKFILSGIVWACAMTLAAAAPLACLGLMTRAIAFAVGAVA